MKVGARRHAQMDVFWCALQFLQSEFLLMKMMGCCQYGYVETFPFLPLPQESSLRKEGLMLLTLSGIEGVC